MSAALALPPCAPSRPRRSRAEGLLSNEEEIGLGRRVRAGRQAAGPTACAAGGKKRVRRGSSGGRLDRDGTEARDALVGANLRLVVWAVNRWWPRLVAHEDLMAAGYLGLVRAASLWDPERGVRFSTYA